MEEETEDKIVRETRLVIALDYGTTFTGVGYATPQGNECPLDEVGVNKIWGDQMNNTDKVASVISYSEPSQNREQQWGTSLAPSSVAMVHTKLELDTHDVFEELDLTIQALDGMRNLNFQHIKTSKGQRGLPSYTQKSPEEIVSDYLTKVFEHAGKAIDEFAGRLRGEIATDIVVTIPTGWSYMAINSTYRALSKAGFNRESFPRLREILFISEPEAAARYTVRYLKETQGDTFLRENGYFVLCDAGGGTVDVVSYRVKQLAPTLQLQEIGCPTGHRCGSIFINIEFKRWLRRLIGDKYYSQLDPQLAANKISSHSTEGRAMRELMAAFDEHKVGFEGNNGQIFQMDLPNPLHNLNIPGIVDLGQITLKASDMEMFFDTCVAQIVELIRGHMLQIENRGGRPKNVFLVGGFGESQYLQRQIEYTLGLSDIRLRRPHTSWTAVVQGAVICGIEKSTTRSLRPATTCKHSYGISLDTLFSDAYHSQRDLVRDSSNVPLAEGQLIWMLNKGDLCLRDEERTVEQEILLAFAETDSKAKVLPIYRYSYDDRPERYRNSREELDTVVKLTIDLNTAPLHQFDIERAYGKNKPATYKAHVKLVLKLRNEVLKASVWWKDLEWATTENIPY
ncbi:hypothetical protein BDV96DRAFT_574453 [Lophiotrema nucula]|uniref:Actin-like ATPase domain-containing protein n=1 Tax=Lophiotrema nucula TaxID=690887 RepID=A0A6A5ZBF0_9PLEO|nr:hypothetical protein BDV96DRAFT_574453 [Lophiotrema nucula]